MTRSNIKKKQTNSSNSSNSSLPLIDENFIKKQSKKLSQYYLPNDVYLTKINQTKRLNSSLKKPKKFFFINKKHKFTKFQKPPEDVIPNPTLKLINQEFIKNNFENKIFSNESYIEKVPNYLFYINSMQNYQVPNFKTNQFEKLKVQKNLIYEDLNLVENLNKNLDDNLAENFDKNLKNFNVLKKDKIYKLKELNKSLIMSNEDNSSSICETGSIDFRNHSNLPNFNKFSNSFINNKLKTNSINSDCSQMILSKSIELDSELENISLNNENLKIFNEKKIFDEKFSKNFHKTNIFDTNNVEETNKISIEPYKTLKEDNEIIKRSINFHSFDKKDSFGLNEKDYLDLNRKDYLDLNQKNLDYKPNYLNKINLKLNDLEKIDDKMRFKEPMRQNCLHKFEPQKQSEMQKNFLITIKKHYYPEYENIWSFVVLTCVTLIYSIQNIFQIEHLLIIDSSVYFNSSLSLSVFCGAISSCVSFFLAPFVISLCKHKSSRLIALLGSIMCFLGLLFTSFATLPGQLLFAYPFFFGIGSSLLRESSLMILSKYYKRRRLLVEMIVKFFSYLLYGFLPITLSYVINIKNWRYGLQSYSIMFLVCFFLCVLMRPASLYHPQRRAILHLKNLQKRNKIKRKQSEQIEKNIFSSTSLIIKNLRNSLNFVDYSTLRSRTVQLLLCSFCLLSFGLFTPIFVLLPTLFIDYNYNIISLYYIQLVFGLSGCLSPILIYVLFHKTESKESIQETKIENNHKKQPNQRKIFNPLFLIKLSCFFITLLQFSLINLNFENFITLLIIMALYAFFFSLLFTSLKIFVLRKVRAKSVCSLWAWFQLSQSIPLLTGVTFSAFLNDNFNYNVGTYFSSFCCLIGFLTLFSIDIHRKLSKKHIENYLKDAKNTKLWSTNLFNEKQSKNILNQMTHNFCGNLPSKEILFENDKKYFEKEHHPSKYHKINYCLNKNFFHKKKINNKKNVSKKNSLNFFENSHQLKNYKNDDSVFKFSLDNLLINNNKMNTENKSKKFFSLPEISKNFNETEIDFKKDEENYFNNLDDEYFFNFEKQPSNIYKKKKNNYFDDKDYLSSSEKSSNYELNMDTSNENYFFNSLVDFDEKKIENEENCSSFECNKDKIIKNSISENTEKLKDNSMTKKNKEKKNNFLGQLVCEDYHSLVESLIKSKKEKKHEDDCIVVNLVQEILKQITIKNLSEDFNQTSQCDSSNNSNEVKTKNNSLKINDIYLEHRNYSPSKNETFQKCSSNKCLNCDNLIS